MGVSLTVLRAEVCAGGSSGQSAMGLDLLVLQDCDSSPALCFWLAGIPLLDGQSGEPTPSSCV